MDYKIISINIEVGFKFGQLMEFCMYTKLHQLSKLKYDFNINIGCIVLVLGCIVLVLGCIVLF